MAKGVELVLPRTDDKGDFYLSYSQISTWKRSKREYIRQYFFGERFTGNSYTDFGSKVGEALESGDFSEFTDKEVEFLETIPRYDQFERKIRLNFEGFYVTGYIDSNKSNFKDILDYKTGDMSKAAEYEDEKYYQLEIYSMALEQETGILPDTAKVILVERTGNAFKGEELKLGAQYDTVFKPLDAERLEYVKRDIIKVASEISNTYRQFLIMCEHESIK